VSKFLAIAALSYLPVVYHRFGFRWGIDWGGLVFDVLYAAFLLRFLYVQRNATAGRRKETAR